MDRVGKKQAEQVSNDWGSCDIPAPVWQANKITKTQYRVSGHHRSTLGMAGPGWSDRVVAVDRRRGCRPLDSPLGDRVVEMGDRL